MERHLFALIALMLPLAVVAFRVNVKGAAHSPTKSDMKVKELAEAFISRNGLDLNRKQAMERALQELKEEPDLDIEKVKEFAEAFYSRNGLDLNRKEAMERALEELKATPDLDIEKVKEMAETFYSSAGLHLNRKQAMERALQDRRAVQTPIAKPPSHHGGFAFAWNSEAICDGFRAEERAQWLVQNQDMSRDSAQQQVMREFPSQFGGGPRPITEITTTTTTVAKASCSAPVPSENADPWGHHCKEGESIPHGGKCTGTCRMRHKAVPSSVTCDDGHIDGFRCVEDVDPRALACKVKCEKEGKGSKWTLHDGVSKCECVTTVDLGSDF